LENNTIPVILAGGSGKRLWPLSRKNYPKQFLKIYNEYSLFQNTALKIMKEFRGPLLISTRREYKAIIEQQLKEIKIKAEFIIEPVSRNTAPSIILTYLLTSRAKKNLIFFPCDHYVESYKEINGVLKGNKSRTIVLFGVKPTFPSTQFGYIDLVTSRKKLKEVRSFCEKPNLRNAKRFFNNKSFFWNSGIFYLPKNLEELLKSLFEDFDLLESSIESYKSLSNEVGKINLNKFKRIKSASFDDEILSKTKQVYCFPFKSTRWSDLGSWSEIHNLMKDKNANFHKGEVKSLGSKNTLIISEKDLILLNKVKDLMIIEHENGLLISTIGNLDGIEKLISSEVLGQGENIHSSSSDVRPWGYFKSLESGKKYKVKKLVIKNGHKLSLQKHNYRSEHWVVVEGEGSFTKNGKTKLVKTNDHLLIKVGDTHTISNNGSKDLVIIEVQYGSKILESDIKRIKDDYNR